MKKVDLVTSKFYITISHLGAVIEEIPNKVYYPGVCLVLLFYFFLGLPNLHFPGGLRFFSVKSQSMAPALNQDTLIVVKRSDDYQIGDIITFYSGEFAPKAKTITHRVDKIIDKLGISHYQTKGDANIALDKDLISNQHIIGRVIFTIPFAGWLINFLESGRLAKLLFSIPGLTIIIIELTSLFTGKVSSRRLG